MNELIVLSLVDGKTYHVDSVKVPEKQKRIRALRDWIKAHGEDGITYRLAKWATPPVLAQEIKVMESKELPLQEPKPKAEKKQTKPEAVEA